MPVLVRVLLGGVESTISAESVERDPVHTRLLRLRGVDALTLPDAPDFEVRSASVPRDSVLWYVEGAVPDPSASGRIEPEPESSGGRS